VRKAIRIAVAVLALVIPTAAAAKPRHLWFPQAVKAIRADARKVCASYRSNPDHGCVVSGGFCKQRLSRTRIRCQGVYDADLRTETGSKRCHYLATVSLGRSSVIVRRSQKVCVVL
jgi:hypothetical protein